MRIKAAFKAVKAKARPQIKAIKLRAKIESQDVSRRFRVMQVSSRDGFTPLAIERDMGRSSEEGAEELVSGYYVFPNDSARVRLSAADPDQPVEAWKVVQAGHERIVKGSQLDIKLDTHAVVEAIPRS